MRTADTVEYETSPPVTNEALNALFADAWPDHQPRDFTPLLTRSLAHVCAQHKDRLVGFVNVAWDSGRHAFLLDTTVRSDMQRRGIGLKLVSKAKSLARDAGVEWLHVDYEARLGVFYEKCGFDKTEGAGLIRLVDRGE